jgi:hypothetical protein
LVGRAIARPAYYSLLALPGASMNNTNQSLRRSLKLGLAVSAASAALLSFTSLSPLSSQIDLYVEVSGLPNQRYGYVSITNLSKSPIEIRELRVNRRRDDACVDRQSRKLATGERLLAGTNAAVLGLCGGSIVRATAVTDRGEVEYAINW